jgi:sulfate-transporting ATPase
MLPQWNFHLFGAFVGGGTALTVALTVILALAVGAVFRFTRLGSTSTALSESPLVAESVGISPHPTGLAVWGLGGAMGALAGILLLPVSGLSVTNISALILPAMAAALLGRFRLVSVTVLGGLAIGVLSSILLYYHASHS